MQIFIFFLVFRIFDFLVSFLAPNFVPYLGFFPYKELLPLTNLPQWMYSFANFDGLHYITIASQGYQQFEEAFFPLYPILIYLTSFLTAKNYLIAGLLVSNTTFIIGLHYFKKYATEILPKNISSWWALIFVIVFPTSFFFGAIYTEGLFFFLSIGYLYFLHKKNYTLAGVFGFFAALTRLVGVFLIIPLLVELFVLAVQKHKQKSFTKVISSGISGLLDSFLKKKEMLLAFFLPIAGLLSYMGYLLIRTGDPLFFLTAQPSFGANRSTSLVILPQVLYRYIKIFLTATPNFQYLVSVIEFVIFLFVFILLIWQLWKIWQTRTEKTTGLHLGLNLFSIANIMLPTLTGTLSSTPRYALMSFSLFFILATLQSKIAKILIALIFVVLHVVLLSLFVQGYFVS